MVRLLVPLVALLLAGCTSLHRYGSARTMPGGSFSMVTAMELIEGEDPLEKEPPRGDFLPFAQRLGLRYAPFDGSEIGLEAGFVTATLDWKQELFRSRWIDVAVDPAFTVGYSAGELDPLAVAQLPVLVGIHATDWLTVVPQASVGWGYRDADMMDARTPLVGGALGLYVSITEWLAVQPLGGMTVELDSGYRYLSGGIGLLAGRLPAGRSQ